MKQLLLLISLLATIWPSTILADPLPVPAEYTTVEAEELPHYTIAIKPSGPFARMEKGQWKGLSVDLVRKLAKRLKFNYDFVSVETITALLSMPEMKTTDMAIGAISLSSEREKVVDFSHPYFTTTQGILTQENGSIIWFIAKRIIAVFIALAIAMYALGFVVARLDPKDDIDNAHKGAWFTLVTFTTTGYGDLVPRNVASKIFAAFIMLSSMFMASGFTSYVTTTLTLEKLSGNAVTVADLASKRTKVVAVGGTTTSSLLNMLEINHSRVASPAAGMELVTTGKANAFVYDKAILDFMVLNSDNESLTVHPLNRGMERYGIAFQANSELREQFNVEILAIINSSEWKQLSAQYFGN